MARCVSQKPQSIKAEKQVRFNERVEIFVIKTTTFCDNEAPSLPRRSRLAAPTTNRKRDLSPMLPSSKVARPFFLGCRWESGKDHARDQAPTIPAMARCRDQAPMRPTMARCRDEAPRPVIARSHQAGAPCQTEHSNLKARTNFDMPSKKRLEGHLESRTRIIEQAFEILDRETNAPSMPETTIFKWWQLETDEYILREGKRT